MPVYELTMFGVGLLLTVGTGFFVASEFSLVNLNRSDLESRVARGEKRLGLTIGALKITSTHLSSAQLGITLTTLLTGYTMEPAIRGPLAGPPAGLGFPPALATRRGRGADQGGGKGGAGNLLPQQIKGTPGGGAVEVATAGKAGGFWLGVADEGIGMSEEDLKRIGRPFEQAEGAYTREHEGTGLGLSLVRSFVEMHGGTIRVESAVGKGTTFIVDLPIQPPPRPPTTGLGS